MGTWQGLFSFNLSTEKITHYQQDTQNKNPIGGDMIFDISEDSSGSLDRLC